MCEQHPKGLSPAGREKVIQLRDEGLTSSANRKENAAGEYLKRLELGDEEANSFLMTETYLVYETRRTGIKGILYEHLNRAKHMWMWDTQSLSSALLNHGFRSAHPCKFGDCEDPMFAAVEDAARFEHDVAIEARF
jgi:hypothetical protein